MKKQKTRIIIGCFPEKRAAEIMCQAYKLNMTTRYGHVWSLPFWIHDHSFDRWENTRCTEMEMRDALEFAFRYKVRELADNNFATDSRNEM